MNDIGEALGVSIGLAIVFGVPFAFFAFVRYLRYKETIALAERGLLRPERMRNGRDTLRWGIVITMLGIGLMCGSLTIGFAEDASGIDIGVSEMGTTPDGMGVAEGALLGIDPWIMLGILPFFFGLALLIIYYVGKHEDKGEETAVEPDPIPPHKAHD